MKLNKNENEMIKRGESRKRIRMRIKLDKKRMSIKLDKNKGEDKARKE